MSDARTPPRTLALLLAATLSATALAHGDQHKSKVDYSEAEQHAFGKAADPARAAQTVRVEMSDQMRFDPAVVEVARGETVRFVVHNGGKLMHEMVLGTQATLDEHAELMKKFPGMEHDEPYMAHVAPGEEQVIGWTFNEPGTYHFGCLVPGHYDAGMKGTIVVR